MAVLIALSSQYAIANTELAREYGFTGSFSEGLAAVKLDGKWGFINTAGKEITPLKYDDTMLFSEGLARVGLDGKYGYVNKAGKEVIPVKYNISEAESEKDKYLNSLKE